MLSTKLLRKVQGSIHNSIHSKVRLIFRRRKPMLKINIHNGMTRLKEPWQIKVKLSYLTIISIIKSQRKIYHNNNTKYHLKRSFLPQYQFDMNYRNDREIRCLITSSTNCNRTKNQLMKENKVMQKNSSCRIDWFRNNSLYIPIMAKNKRCKMEEHELGLKFSQKVNYHPSNNELLNRYI